jgi:hypothetical protein
MDFDREQLRRTYEVSRIGFGVLAASLALACVTWMVPLLWHLYPEFCLGLMGSRWYRWLDAPVTWGSLLGVTLLWGRFEHAGWQRRVGLLLVMSLVDAGLWMLDHGAALGFADADLGHEWLRTNLGQALGWAEFALMAGLSCEYLEHLGVEYARESGKSTRSMAAFGAVLWLLLFCQRTNWSAGWPLAAHRIRSLEEYLLLEASHLISTITLIQVTALAISATKRSGQVLADMRLEDESLDPFKPTTQPAEEVDVRGV